MQAPTKAEIMRHVAQSSANSSHIFVGMRHLRCVVVGIAACIRHKRQFFIMHEPRVREGWKGKLRFIQSWLTEARLRRTAYILAVGAHGANWFLRTGYKPERIFPFAYFVNKTAEGAGVGREDRPIRIGYVGRLEKAKGIADLLAAVPYITADFELHLVGTGQYARECEELARQDSRIRYLGVLPVDAVQRHMQQLDILVQPSLTTDDGWGVVVSEALLNGAAIVASDVVGATACLAETWRGRIVPTQSPRKIAEAINALAAGDLLSAESRIRRTNWANLHLSANIGANYFIDIINHVNEHLKRPKPFIE